MTDWQHVLHTLNLPNEPVVLVAAPMGDSVAVQALLQVRPSAQVTRLDGALPDRASQAPVAAPSELPCALAAGGVDAILFDHAMDDIAIDAVSRHEGLGARDAAAGQYSPWARALRAYWRTGDLEQVVGPAFVGLLKDYLPTLSRSARIVIHHRVIGSDLLAGQPLDLYTEYIEMARRWIKASSLRLQEVRLDSFDPQWWLCLERDD